MSKPAVEFRELRPGDVEHIAAHLRDQDAAEAAANGHTDILLALRDKRRSQRCRSGRDRPRRTRVHLRLRARRHRACAFCRGVDGGRTSCRSTSVYSLD